MNMNKKIKIILSIIVAICISLVLVLALTKTKKNSEIQLENGVQLIKMSESAKGYQPNNFTLKKGVPVRWEIEASTDRTCASALIVPDYKIREFLKPGKNVIEFTPDKTGLIPFSCSMRMYTGKFNVIE